MNHEQANPSKSPMKSSLSDFIGSKFIDDDEKSSASPGSNGNDDIRDVARISNRVIYADIRPWLSQLNQ